MDSGDQRPAARAQHPRAEGVVARVKYSQKSRKVAAEMPVGFGDEKVNGDLVIMAIVHLTPEPLALSSLLFPGVASGR